MRLTTIALPCESIASRDQQQKTSNKCSDKGKPKKTVALCAGEKGTLDPVGLDGDILIRHDEAGVLAAGAEDGHIVGGPAVEGVARLGSGVDVDRGSCRMAASAGSAGARAAQGDVVILGTIRVGDLDGKLLRVRAAAIGGLDGELELAGLGGCTLDGVAHQRQAVRQSAGLDAPGDGVGAGGNQDLAVRIAHLAVWQGNGGDGGLGGNIGALGGIEGVGQDHAVRVVIAGQIGADRGRLALDGVVGGLNGEYACASGLQRDLHGVDRARLELFADGKGRTVRSHPLGVRHGVGAVGGGGLRRGSVLDGLCDGQVLHHDAGQHGDHGFASCLHSAAVNALLMLLAICIGGRGGVYHPLPVVVGGFGVVCGFAGLLALGAGTAMGGVVAVGRPVAKVVGFHLEIVACCAGLDMYTGVHIHPILRIGIVSMADRYGAACGFGSAGDCDNCRALCLSGYLAGAANCCNIRLVARPNQAARCVDRLLHGGELIGRVKLQIYLCRGNGEAGKLNDGGCGHGDIKEGSLRKRFVFGAAFLDGNQLQLGFLRCGMSRFRLDLAVLQLNIIILHHIRSAVGSSLENAPFQMIAAVLGQQLRKIGRKLRLVIFAQGNILVCEKLGSARSCYLPVAY